MKILTASQIKKKPSLLRKYAEEYGEFQIDWRDQKPNGEVIFSVVVKGKSQGDSSNPPPTN